MSKRKNENDHNYDQSTPPKKRGQIFKSSYSAEWNCLVASQKANHFVRCTVCQSEFSCKHGGRYDCKRHVESDRHGECNRVQASIPKLDVMFKEKKDDHSTTKAEIIFCRLIARLNLSLSSADVLVPTFQAMFHDSGIAKDMKCNRNKATAVIVELAKLQKEVLSERLKQSIFTISTDGSNDDKSKQYPLVVRSVDEVSGTVNSELLSVPICEGSATGENIFHLMDDEMKKWGIPWKNCISFGSDNANVMVGKHKGVFAFLKAENEDMFLSGCCLHLVHIAAKKAVQAALPPIDDVLVDIFYFFNKSEKRLSSFKGMQDLCDVQQKRMLKHVCTRWLSIKRCLERFLVNWEPLKAYFKEEAKRYQKSSQKSTKSDGSQKSQSGGQKSTDDGQKSTSESEMFTPSYAEKKSTSIYEFVRSPTNKLYVLFLNYTTKIFDEILLGLQSEEPKVHVMRRSFCKLVRTIFSRFLKPSAMGKPLLEVQYRMRYNIKSNSDLVMGRRHENSLRRLKNTT